MYRTQRITPGVGPDKTRYVSSAGTGLRGGIRVTEVLRVSSKSNPNALAGAVAAVIRAAGVVELHVVGAGALNQAVKAVAIARGYLIAPGLDVACRPVFAEIAIEGQSRTGIRLVVERQRELSRIDGDAVSVAPLLCQPPGRRP